METQWIYITCETQVKMDTEMLLMWSLPCDLCLQCVPVRQATKSKEKVDTVKCELKLCCNMQNHKFCAANYFVVIQLLQLALPRAKRRGTRERNWSTWVKHPFSVSSACSRWVQRGRKRSFSVAFFTDSNSGKGTIVKGFISDQGHRWWIEVDLGVSLRQ